MMGRFVTGMLDLLAPPECASCEGPLMQRSLGFCEGCRPLIERVHSRSCDDLAACVYGGPLRDALHRFKYRGASELSTCLSSWLELPAQQLLGRVELVVPVPLHARRLRERGYNQSALLALPLARSLGLPFAPRAIERVRATTAQVGRTRRERLQQLSGAFTASTAVRARSVLVIDDVRTTGATFEAIRGALHAAGARHVATLSLALADDEVEVAAGL